MKGTVSSIESHGSIIAVWLDLDNGISEPVYMEHQAFGWLLEGEGCEPGDFIGRTLCFNG